MKRQRTAAAKDVSCQSKKLHRHVHPKFASPPESKGAKAMPKANGT
jgi:hypothetical protein